MKIRRLADDERSTRSFPLQAYAFDRSPTGPAGAEEIGRSQPYHAGNTTLVMEDGDTTLAAVTAIPMRQNLRGTVYPMAGVAGVVTHPLARRRGYVRTLLIRLLGEMREAGHPISALYPFRSSFYERFGYAGFPKTRRVTFTPADLGQLVHAPLPGDVTWQRIKDGYEEYRDLTHRLLGRRHGFAVFPDHRAERLRDADARWLVTARVDGEVVGAVTYRIEDHGGVLAADPLLTTGPLSRALLLRFFAQHVDQVAQVTTTVGADETPELWATDLATRTESVVSFPTSAPPMGRVLSLDALRGLETGPGRVRVEIVDDPFVGGTHLLDGDGGRLDVAAERAGLDVAAGAAGPPVATLTAAGLSALVYGVLDPADVVIRGLGTVPDDAAAELRSIFPRRTPFLFADF